MGSLRQRRDWLPADPECKSDFRIGSASSTAVQDTFGVAYGRVLAGAVLTGLPVALAYLIFQKRVTQAITLSAGIKG